jgi:hypothetical protein
LFIATFVTSIGAKILFVSGIGGSFDALEFVPGSLSENTVYVAAILEFLLIVTNIGTAVVLYPIAKRQSERLALGFVAARVVESTFILVGLLSVVSLVSVNEASAEPRGPRQPRSPHREAHLRRRTTGRSSSVPVSSSVWGTA